MKTYWMVLCAGVLGAGCGGSTEDLAGVDEEVGLLQEALWKTWSASSQNPNQAVGMAIIDPPSVPDVPQKLYMWLNTGVVCRGSDVSPCLDTYNYSAPGNDFAAIRAVGIAKNTGQTYAWYSDSTVSRGSSDNLTAHNGKLAFTRAANPGGGLFTMNQLVEVDNSDNGSWYYYWLDAGGVVWRTTGTSGNSQSHSTAVQVTSPFTASIVGIAFGSTVPAELYTYYNDGWLNISTSSLNLSQ